MLQVALGACRGVCCARQEAACVRGVGGKLLVVEMGVHCLQPCHYVIVELNRDQATLAGGGEFPGGTL